MTDINARIAEKKGVPGTQYDKHGFVVDYIQTPDYTTDWRLAGELLEEVSKTPGWDVSLHWEQVDENDENNPAYEWTCYMTYWDDNPDNFKSFHVSADTPQMAIALAWLEWREG